MTPSIKGLALAGLVEDLLAARRDGHVTEAELAKHLEPDDLALLDDFDGFAWVPVTTYERLSTELARIAKRDDSDHHRERGAAAARRLLERGLYQQLESLKAGPSWTAHTYRSQVRMIATLHGSLLNFSTWQVCADPEHPGRVMIEVSDAGKFPEALRHAVEGFIGACASVVSQGSRWYSERPTRACIRFRMERDFGA